MKKYLFSIFVMILATMVGCQKSDVDGLLEESNNSANKITVTADIANDGQTRVALTPDVDNEGKPIVKVNWRTSGEKFDVYGINGGWVGPTTFEQIEGTNQFEGSLPNNGDCVSYVVTYPSGVYSHTSTLIYDKSIFTSQNGKLSENKTLMLAYPSTLNENTKLEFMHSTTLLMPKFRVRGATVNLSPTEIQTITFKSMPIDGGTADFNIDCTGHGAKDNDVYVYLPTYDYKIEGLQTIEVVVTTRDEKIYDGEINIGGTTLYAGKLYTANIWLYESNVITYTTTDDNILTLSTAWVQGTNYTSHTFANGVGKIVLKDGVTTLPANAFKRQEKLRSFVLPMQITAIGDSVFQQCCYLESISMPNVTAIGNSAFDMDGLHWPDYNLGETLKVTSLDLSKVTTLGDRSLFKLVSLQSIDISGATSIGSEVFYECGNLTSVKMPKQDCTLGASAFIRCGLTNIDLSNITSIGACAFGWINKPTSIIINRVNPPAIGETILRESSSEIKIYVPDGSVNTYKAVTNLEQYADKIKSLNELQK